MSSALVLPPAPPVVRAATPRSRRRRAPALALVVLGLALVVLPVATGLFGKVAAGQQLLDTFAPHLQQDRLDAYRSDLATLRRGEAAVVQLYGARRVPSGRFAGLDDWQRQAPAIDGRATSLLDTVAAARPDYEQVASIGGFDRLPFLVVTAGLGLTASGLVLASRTRHAGAAATLALASAVALVAVPFLSGTTAHAGAGSRLLSRISPIVTTPTVVSEQRDFVVLVHAVGELETGFRAVPGASTDPDVRGLVAAWPQISSDLASLVGDLNDSITDVGALRSLDRLGGPVSGFAALPWALVALGALAATLTAATFVGAGDRAVRGVRAGPAAETAARPAAVAADRPVKEST